MIFCEVALFTYGLSISSRIFLKELVSVLAVWVIGVFTEAVVDAFKVIVKGVEEIRITIDIISVKIVVVIAVVVIYAFDSFAFAVDFAFICERVLKASFPHGDLKVESGGLGGEESEGQAGG